MDLHQRNLTEVTMTLPTLSVDRTHTLTLLLHAELKHRRASCGNRKQRGQGYNANRGSKVELMFLSGSMTIGSSYHTKGSEK
jgi:hypothetical protein